jgi:hypothetical protein
MLCYVINVNSGMLFFGQPARPCHRARPASGLGNPRLLTLLNLSFGRECQTRLGQSDRGGVFLEHSRLHRNGKRYYRARRSIAAVHSQCLKLGQNPKSPLAPPRPVPPGTSQQGRRSSELIVRQRPMCAILLRLRPDGRPTLSTCLASAKCATASRVTAASYLGLGRSAA